MLIVPTNLLANAANERIDPTKIALHNPANLNSNFTEEWRFGGGLYSLNGVHNYLTQLVPGTPSPTFSGNTVLPPQVDHEGMLVPINEAHEETIVLVLPATPPPAQTIIFGNLTATPSDGGMGLLWDLATGTYRTITRGFPGVGTDAILPPGIRPGQYFILSIRNSATISQSIRTYTGSTSGSEVLSTGSIGTRTLSTPHPGYVLGERYYTNAWGNPINIGALAIAPSYLTDAAMLVAETNIRADCIARGLAMF